MKFYLSAHKKQNVFMVCIETLSDYQIMDRIALQRPQLRCLYLLQFGRISIKCSDLNSEHSHNCVVMIEEDLQRPG